MALILLIEDEPSVRRLARAVLEPEHTITEATTGEAAMDLIAQQGRPDLILLDVCLSGALISGLEFLAELRRTGDDVPFDKAQDVPVLILSGYSEPEASLAALLDENTKYLPKPYNIGVLRRLVSELVEGTRE